MRAQTTTMARAAITLAAWALLGIAGPASADAAVEARLRDQLRQTITDLRQLQDENITLKAKLAAQPAAPVIPPEELHKQELQLQESRAAAQRAQQDAQVLLQQIEALKQQLAGSQAATAEGDRKQGELGRQLQTAQRNADALRVQFDSCQAKNRQLAGLFDEVLGEFSHRGVVDALLAREPLTGLKRAQLERLTEEYRGRADSTSPDADHAAGPGK